MTEEKKRQYFYMGIGYIGFLLIFVAGLRYILLLNDGIAQGLLVLAVICLGRYFNYVESKLLSTTKEKRIFKLLFLGMVIIIGIIGLFVISNK